MKLTIDTSDNRPYDCMAVDHTGKWALAAIPTAWGVSVTVADYENGLPQMLVCDHDAWQKFFTASLVFMSTLPEDASDEDISALFSGHHMGGAEGAEVTAISERVEEAMFDIMTSVDSKFPGTSAEAVMDTLSQFTEIEEGWQKRLHGTSCMLRGLQKVHERERGDQ